MQPENDGDDKPSKKPFVLLADDSDISRKYIRMLLCREYEVIEAVTGQDVINLLQRGDVDYQLLLLDLNMPGVDGWDVLKFLRDMDLLSVLPVIVVSAMAVSPETLVKCYDSGAWAVVTKPFSENVILSQIRSFVARVEGVKKTACKESHGDVSLLRIVMDASANAVFAEDAASHAIIYANARFVALTGGKPVEGRTLADVVGVTAAQAFLSASRQAISSHSSAAASVSLAPGAWHSLTYTVLEDAAKQPSMLVGTITNLTGLMKRVHDLESMRR